ncbi:TetR/AcrR family transcriptional regulator [Couchioplanes azureus]|uniref:TetR/AcrR family transcriptional regulator n=1 Tax=Couchioplanes caeruleus TaxID=56438 RepID=UPI0019B90287|nr:TetR family transcriptional regulator [Couchioplanes caeruleus]GGQ74032.1 TetR family transcriptional regulator [Couchioplanes caeruleus subsp. azureus]
MKERDDILRAAAEFLGRRPNATQDEIARAAGVSRATLHRHFAGRTALFAALEQLAVAQMRQALATARLADGPATDALARLVAASQDASAYLALMYSQSQEYDPEHPHEAWAEIDAEIAALFRRGQEAGEFRLDLGPAWLADAFYSLAAGAAWSVQTGRAAARDFTHMVTTLLLHGAVRR